MTRWIGLACALIVLTGATTFLYQMLPEPVPEPKIEFRSRTTSGPPPKLEVIGQKVHDFGTLAVNTKGSHTWQFKNVGQGNLEVWVEHTSCSCTIAGLKTDEGRSTKTVPPGGSVPIEVTWEARKWADRFGQTAEIGTNDPDNATVNLSVLGKIIAPVAVEPGEWIVFPEISAEESHRQTVAIVSPDRADLKLTKLASSKPGLIVAEAKPMNPKELERRKVKSGYDLTVEIKPGLPPGRFTEELMIETDHPDRLSLKLTIAGSAFGPISVVPIRLVMPSVASPAGASQDLELIVRGAESTHFEVASKPEALRVAIAPEDKPGSKGKYRLTVTVPPGTAPGVLDDPIVLKTDHPKIHEVKIPVRIYVSSRSEAG
jgi:Protein of unknown function (DUF1573)